MFILNSILTKTCHLFNCPCMNSKIIGLKWVFVPPQFSMLHAVLTQTLMIWITHKTCRTDALETTQWVLTQCIYAARICCTLVDIQTANLVRVTSGARRTFTVEASWKVGAKSTTGAEISLTFINVWTLEQEDTVTLMLKELKIGNLNPNFCKC